jgi:D-serine dehydratase
MGKRDVAFDAGLPQATKSYRQGYKSPINCDIQWQVIKVMDQHAFMSVPKDVDIKIGDMVAFSTSHPCLTFDKWRWLCLVDDNYRVVDVMNTQF